MQQAVLSPVRKPLAEGRRSIAGLWLPHDWYSEEERQKIVWRYWRKSAQLVRFPSGDLLHFPVAMELLCCDLPGWPLLSYSSTLSAADLSAQEIKQLPKADCWIIRGSMIDALHFRDGVEIDPAQWLELSDYDFVACFEVVLPPVVVESKAPVVPENIREVLGDAVAPPAEQQAGVLQKIHSKAKEQRLKKAEDNEQEDVEYKQNIGLIGTFFGFLGKAYNFAVWVSISFIVIIIIAMLIVGTVARLIYRLSESRYSYDSHLADTFVFAIAAVLALAYFLPRFWRKFIGTKLFGRWASRIVEDYQKNTKVVDDAPSRSNHRPLASIPSSFIEDDRPSSGNAHQTADGRDNSQELERGPQGGALESRSDDDFAQNGHGAASGAGDEHHQGSGAQNQVPANGHGSRQGRGRIKVRDEELASRPAIWRRLLVRFAMMTQMSRMIGKRQARYLNNMIKMFDEGDFANALRHAVPLTYDEGKSQGQAFGVPKPRNNLELSTDKGGGVSLGLGDEASMFLANLYRHAFEQLKAQRRVEEATFILAELLDDKAGALDYLEENGRVKQAAELALAWDMAPELIVRLYCLAGEWDYAIAIARRDGAFAGAVMRLEREAENTSAAARLREEWARFYADSGDWLYAITILWPLENKRDLALGWLLKAEENGGELGAAALVKRAILLPETLDEQRTRLDAICSNSDARPLQRLVEEIINSYDCDEADERDVGLRRLARFVTRPVFVRHQKGELNLALGCFTSLLKASGQKALEADLPKGGWEEDRTPSGHNGWDYRLFAPERGLPVDIHDVVVVGEGRYLLALGDGGVMAVNRKGQKIGFYDVPASRFVVSISGTVVLALMQREELWRIARINLQDDSVHEFGSLPLTTFARDFEGVGWSVALTDGYIYVLDIARDLEVLWKSGKLPGPVLRIIQWRGYSASCEEGGEHWWIALSPDEGEIWQYELPARILRKRQPLPAYDPEKEILCADEFWKAIRYSFNKEQGGEDLVVDYERVLDLEQHTPRYVSLSTDIPYDPEVHPRVYAFWQKHILVYGSKVILYPEDEDSIENELEWGDMRFLTARQLNHLIVFDNRGRLFHFDIVEDVSYSITLK